MARRINKHQRPHRDLRITSTGEQRSDGRWIVRSVTGAGAIKTYRCPGCQQIIAAGVPHLVVWPAERGLGTGTIDERRHWHTGCWRSGGAR